MVGPRSPLLVPRLTMLLIAAVSAVLWGGSPVPASASCATDKPPPSPSAFVGVVTATASRGRVATVRIGSGTTVEVVGTPGRRRDESAATSVDRAYEVAGRYVFHPVNDSSPFEDNACTATRLLSRVQLPAATPARGEAVQSSTGARSKPEGALVAIPVAVGVAAVAALLWRTSRRRLGPPLD